MDAFCLLEGGCGNTATSLETKTRHMQTGFAGMTIFAGFYHWRDSLHKHSPILMLFLKCRTKLGLSIPSGMPLNIHDSGVGFGKV